MRFDSKAVAFIGRGLTLDGLAPVIDGVVAPHRRCVEPDGISWQLDDGEMTLSIVAHADRIEMAIRLSGIDPARKIDSIGLRFDAITGVRRYLRNGYHSWDGSFFVEPGTASGGGPPGKAPTLGFAMTALLPESDDGAVILGFTRHDRFQSRFRFSGTRDTMMFDIETLWDRVAHNGVIDAEPIVLFESESVEPGLRRWSTMVAEQSPLPPRIPPHRITGWCSWYNLYAAIDDAVILEHLAGAKYFRGKHDVPIDVFQIDDGFTPEMGDWLDVKPQFPRGMAPLISDIATAGFTPGLWIAPFMVGNRSKLFAEHSDWVVRDAQTGDPIVQMHFYGEFRWHKRSEEYYILDITHPDADAYIRGVFRTWAQEWGVRYFKADFLLFGSEHGPDRAVWHESGLSRIAIWRRMMSAMRAEIGDALLVGCGCPLWASVGLIDAARIGRDVGVSWSGEYSAESLLRDQLTRNHAAGTLWQADPDCILLRSCFHELTNDQVESLAHFAGLSGGVLMTSDRLDDLSPVREAMLASLLRDDCVGCAYPGLGDEKSVIRQVVALSDGGVKTNLINMSDAAQSVDGVTLRPFQSVQITPTSL
jgi:alpha-galactosidase